MILFLDLAVYVLPGTTLGVVETGKKTPMTVLRDARKAFDKDFVVIFSDYLRYNF